MRRKNNLIVFGVAESSGSNSDERKGHDKDKITEIIKVTMADQEQNNLNVVNSFRLGKFTLNKNRPLKIIFEDENSAGSIFFNRFKLVETDKIKDCMLKKIKLERDFLKSLWTELQRRTYSGEKNLKIKYFNGHPKIIDVTVPKNGEATCSQLTTKTLEV